MTMIIQRYLAIEIFKSSFATTLILFIILMSNTLGRVLSDISAGKTPADALMPVMLGQSIHVLNLLLPLGIFLGLVFALGKLYADHELVVLQACGFGYRKLYGMLMILLLPVLLLATGAIWYLVCRIEFIGLPIGDLFLFGGGVLICLFGFRLQELMTGR